MPRRDFFYKIGRFLSEKSQNNGNMSDRRIHFVIFLPTPPHPPVFTQKQSGRKRKAARTSILNVTHRILCNKCPGALTRGDMDMAAF